MALESMVSPMKTSPLSQTHFSDFLFGDEPSSTYETRCPEKKVLDTTFRFSRVERLNEQDCTASNEAQ
jgi:hypothetical protein